MIELNDDNQSQLEPYVNFFTPSTTTLRIQLLRHRRDEDARPGEQ